MRTNLLRTWQITLVLAAPIFWEGAAQHMQAATFSGSASIAVSDDPDKTLTSTTGVFTVSCWFKLFVPSSLSLSQNLRIAMDSSEGDEGAPFSYLLRINATSGALEFLTRDSTTTTTLQLLIGLFVNAGIMWRWFERGPSFTAYVDGSQVAQTGVGSGSTTGNGLAIGGFGGSLGCFTAISSSLPSIVRPFQITRHPGRMFRDKTGDYRSPRITNWDPQGIPTTGITILPYRPERDPRAEGRFGGITFGEVDQAGEHRSSIRG